MAPIGSVPHMLAQRIHLSSRCRRCRHRRCRSCTVHYRRRTSATIRMRAIDRAARASRMDQCRHSRLITRSRMHSYRVHRSRHRRAHSISHSCRASYSIRPVRHHRRRGRMRRHSIGPNQARAQIAALVCAIRHLTRRVPRPRPAPFLVHAPAPCPCPPPSFLALVRALPLSCLVLTRFASRWRYASCRVTCAQCRSRESQATKAHFTGSNNSSGNRCTWNDTTTNNNQPNHRVHLARTCMPPQLDCGESMKRIPPIIQFD